MAPLPRWATLSTAKNKNGVKQKEQIDANFNLEKEETFLRCRAYHRSSDMIDYAAKLSMEETFSPLIDDVHHYFGRFFPQNETNINSDYNMKGESFCKRSFMDNDGKDDDTSKYKKQKVQENGNTANVQDSTPSSTTFQLIHPNDFYHFPPIILPISIVMCPLSLLDRNEMVKVFSQGMKTRGEMRNAIVRLKNFGKVGNDVSHRRSYDTSHASLLHEILCQCILQDDSDKFIHLIEHKNRHNSEYLDSLVEWASETESFDAIIVILENIETISNSCLDSFIGSLSALRSKHGIPISLVLLSVSLLMSQQVNSLSRCNMNEKVVVKDFPLPHSGHLLNRFFELLYTDCNRSSLNFPIIIGKTLLKRIREYFNDIHGSLISTVMQMKIALSYYFCMKGSFYGMVHEKTYHRNNWQRIAFFSCDFNAKCYVFDSPKRKVNINSRTISNWLNDISDKMNFLCLVCKLMNSFKGSFNSFLLDGNAPNEGYIEKKDLSAFECENIIEMYLTRSPSYKDTISDIIGAIKRVPIPKLLDILSNWKDKTEHSMNDGLNALVIDFLGSYFNQNENLKDNESFLNVGRIGRFYDFLNESIILLGEIHGSAEVDKIGTELRSDLAQKFELFAQDMHNDLYQNPLNSFFIFQPSGVSEASNFAQDFEASLCAQPRRMVTKSLAGKSVDTSATYDKALIRGGREDACTIFKLMENRVIETSDWFGLFIEKVLAENCHKVCEKSELLDRFIFAVYELILCGILSRSQSRGDVFEKCTLVWASGK